MKSNCAGLIFLLTSYLYIGSVSCKFVCVPVGKSGNSMIRSNTLPRCATHVSNFQKGIHIREREWISGNETELLPDWADIPLVIKGQQFAIDRVSGIVQSYLYGIAIILSNPQLRDTLLFTGNSNTPRKSGKRYAATVVQIALWIRRAISTLPSEDGNWVLASIANVRRIHSHVGLLVQRELDIGNFTSNVKTSYSNTPIDIELWTAFERDLEESGLRPRYPLRNESQPQLHPMNQLTFAITQWAFMGLVLISPVDVNVYNATEEGLAAFSHLWAVLGYGMGIQDKFNLGLRNSPNELRQLHRQFFKTYIAPHLFNLSHESKFLMEAFIKGAPQVIVGLDPEFLLRGILRDVLGIQRPRHMNARKGIYGSLVDFFIVNVGQRVLHALIPPLDRIVSPIASLYHFVVGFIHFGFRYMSDEAIAKYCYVYDYSL